jgi:DNA-directed RNA polymerase specialized sigma24 family protein
MPNFDRKTVLRAPSLTCAEVLERYYDRLKTWANILARGEQARAHDLVHDLWVHITLTQPDLSNVENLDGYLYRCLRHLYLSQLARASRDALQSVNPIDFDSLQTALWAAPKVEALQMQNELRRICSYVGWRKEVAKSASYFILRFMHGYYLNEIADLAGLSLANVHPKLSQIRSEIRLYLQDPAKLQFSNRAIAPVPNLAWAVVSSPMLFAELRGSLLNASARDCLPKRELLALYEKDPREPLSCEMLAHVVSCERCLDLINRRFGRPDLKDREPLDGIDPSGSGHEAAAPNEGSVDSLLRIVRRRSDDIRHHHPEQLFIAVNGKIVASHNVNSSGNTLSARVERPEGADFVEVFSQQGLRLAFLSIHELPPDGPHEQIQRVELSDKRHLTLTLAFDGLGMQTEVSYIVPYLGLEQCEEANVSAAEMKTGRASLWKLPRLQRPAFANFFRLSVLVAVNACLVVACLFMLNLFKAEPKPSVASRTKAITSQDRLQSSGYLAPGLTEHRVVRYEKAALDGRKLQRGTVEVWRDADSRRWSRHFYNKSHHVIAAESYEKAGTLDAEAGKPEAGDWKAEISSETLSKVPAEDIHIRPVGNGYRVELSAATYWPNVKTAVLLLDAEYRPIEENLRIETGSETYDLKFVRTSFERKPSASVPDRVFQLDSADLRGQLGAHAEIGPQALQIELAEAYIAALAQVSEFANDRSYPIDVVRGASAIRVTGRVSSGGEKNYLMARLRPTTKQNLLQIHLESSSDNPVSTGQRAEQTSADVQVYDMAAGKILMDTSLRKYFVSHGMAAHDLDASVVRFSHEAIVRSQRLLRNAFALKELCNGVSAQELLQVHDSAKREWTEMLLRRVAGLNDDLTGLDDQIRPLLPANTLAPMEPSSSVNDRAAMLYEADHLLEEMQVLNRTVGEAFAYTQAKGVTVPPDVLLSRIETQIPHARAQSIAALAHQLNASINKNSGSAVYGSVHQQP